MLSRRALIVVFGLVIASVFLPDAASAAVAYYRYSIDTYAPGPDKYVGPVASPAGVSGPLTAVYTDALGRITKLVDIRDGKAVGETVYKFAANAKLPTGKVYSEAGEVKSVLRYTRDATGHVTRYDYYTPQGTLTQYWLAKHTEGRIDMTQYSATGAVLEHDTDYYSPAGLRIRGRWYPSASDALYYQSEYDTSTGLATSRIKVEDGKTTVTEKYLRDVNGVLTRVDLYNSDGKPYGRKEYSGGLKRRAVYTFTSGSTQEQRFTYDSARRTSAVTLTFNGKLICTFTYDRLPDGTVARTLATGPTGELYAEYPNAEIIDVDNDGKPIDNEATGKIYKVGKWF